jgi:hypothetical protein
VGNLHHDGDVQPIMADYHRFKAANTHGVQAISEQAMVG